MSIEKVIVLAASPFEADGKFAEFKGGMYLGGQTRIEAATQLSRDDPSVELILVGGYNKPSEGAITTSQKVTDMSRFILGQLPDALIHPVLSLPCTRHNFVAVLNDLAAHNLDVDEIGVLTNGYHMARALVFAEQASEATKRYSKTHFVPMVAESILGSDLSGLIANSEQYRARLVSEERGLRQALSGTYTDSCLTINVDQLSGVISAHSVELLTFSEQAAYQQR
jgi:hypothetical protein